MTYIRLTALSAIAVCLGLSRPPARGAEYCAFQVTVRSPSGTPVRSVLVEELKQDTDELVAQASTDQHGVARICEAPSVGLVKIRVGGKLCGSAVVAYLKPYWMSTRDVHLTYENCQGEEWFPLGGCGLTIRVRDETNAPLPGVQFETADRQPKQRAQTSTSDAFGRIFRFMNYGDVLEGRIEKPGYISATVSDECRRGSSTDREQVIALRRDQEK